ncbi:hypothetical protein ACFLY6_00010 [Candidatus Dependentiae bacterium]
MEIKIDYFEYICNRIIYETISMGFTSIDINEFDFYWCIVASEEYDDDPPEVCMGSLLDEREWLYSVLDDSEDNMPIICHYEWLSRVIQALSYLVFKGKKPNKTVDETIEVKTISRIFDALVLEPKKHGISFFNIDFDHHWDIKIEDLFDTSKQPVPVKCSLGKDYKCLKDMLETNQFKLAEALECLAHLTKAIGYYS